MKKLVIIVLMILASTTIVSANDTLTRYDFFDKIGQMLATEAAITPTEKTDIIFEDYDGSNIYINGLIAQKYLIGTGDNKLSLEKELTNLDLDYFLPRVDIPEKVKKEYYTEYVTSYVNDPDALYPPQSDGTCTHAFVLNTKGELECAFCHIKNYVGYSEYNMSEYSGEGITTVPAIGSFSAEEIKFVDSDSDEHKISAKAKILADINDDGIIETTDIFTLFDKYHSTDDYYYNCNVVYAKEGGYITYIEIISATLEWI